MSRSRSLLPAFLCFAALACNAQHTEPAWLDATGVPQHPLDTTGRAATVLLFIAPDCPISNGYAPEVKRIAETYAPRGVAFYAVHADPRVSPETARTHARDFGYPFPVILDGSQSLAHRTGATATPEAAVLDVEGRVVYLGRIDDLYAGFGKRRHAATEHDLRNALDAVLSDKRIEPIVGPPPLGCEIPPPPA